MPSHFVKTQNGYIEADYTKHDGEVPCRPHGLRVFNPEDDTRHWHPNPQHWHDMVALAKDACGWRCVACNDDWTLTGHHRTYKNWGCEEPGDITVFCAACHKVFHQKRRLAA